MQWEDEDEGDVVVVVVMVAVVVGVRKAMVSSLSSYLCAHLRC